MLSSLQIDNFAVVEHVELELRAGLTVMTGETGTGKSILVDALGLVLGDRADSSVVRHGSRRTEISASFDLDALPATRQWLADAELDSDQECQIRRTINADGRSRAYINGRTVPLAQLRALGEQLIDIHGQHEHQSLLQRAQQRQLLDRYAGHDALLEQVAAAFHRWQGLQQEYQALQEAAQSRDNQLDLIRFQVEELVALDLGERELEQLEEEHRRLAHADQLLEGYSSALAALYEDEASLATRLGQVVGRLQELRRHDDSLVAVTELLDSAAIQIDEAVAELRQRREDLDLDPGHLQDIDQRLGRIHDLARKHRTAARDLPALRTTLLARQVELEESEQRLATLQTHIDAAAAEYRELAAQLGRSRDDAARTLATQVSAAMQPLGMPEARFEVAVERAADAPFSVHGLERIEYLVRTNPDQPAKPLARIASGGELSRISLAIQVITAQQSGTPTLIFDEVDVGIGGRVAEIVGQRLRELGRLRQVLCVTHQAQVAALGHQHLQVQKLTAQGRTRTRITELDEARREEEIARMLGGIEITAQTRAHAGEMLSRSRERAPA